MGADGGNRRNNNMALGLILGRMGTICRLSIALVFAALLLGSATDRASAATWVERSETQSVRLSAGDAYIEIFTEGKHGGAPMACLTISGAEGLEEGCAEVGNSFSL